MVNLARGYKSCTELKSSVLPFLVGSFPFCLYSKLRHNPQPCTYSEGKQREQHVTSSARIPESDQDGGILTIFCVTDTYLQGK